MNEVSSLPAGWRYERIGTDTSQTGVLYPDTLQPRHGVLVLLHGFTGSALSWTPLLEALTQPALPVIALDLPGHGLADAPLEVEYYTMERSQQIILSTLQALGIGAGEAILLGYSLGGRTALYCAFSHYFQALILESASPGLAAAAERAQRRISDEALAERIEREGVEAFVNYWERLPLFASQHTLPAEVWQAQRTQRLDNRAIGLANSLRGCGTGAQPPLHHRLAELNLPVLLITGELDSKFVAIAQEMLKSFPDVEYQCIAGAGHTVHMEQPARFIEAVSQFCTRVL